jgi:hypothetical protein
MEQLIKIFSGVTVTVSLGDALALLILLVGIIAWFIRLESKVNYLEKDQAKKVVADADNNKAIWEKFTSFQVTLHEILVALGRVEGTIASSSQQNSRNI